MLITLVVLIILFLSVQVFPIAVGISPSGNWGRAILFVVILAITQCLSFWLGLKLGSTFMHLMDGFKSVVFLFGFLLIGIRMLMETINIRKGHRSLQVNTYSSIAFAAIAQGVNTFLSGLLFNYLSIDTMFTLIALLIFSILIATTGMIIKFGKQTLSLVSFLYALGGLFMIISSIYISFFMF